MPSTPSPRPRLRPVALGAAVLALAGPAVLTPGAAHADDRALAPPKAVTLAKGLVSPLSVAVGRNGVRWVSQNFTGTLLRQAPGGKPKPVYSSGGAEVGAVSVRDGVVMFAITGKKRIQLKRLGADGRAATIADLGAYEKRVNPDRGVRYGFERIGARCADRLPPEVGPARYRGIVESHPYATAQGDGVTYVADAAANAILAVDRRGTVSTVALVPPVPVRVTAAAAEAGGLPACTVGKTYRFEGVPTDVEIGPDGWLYVSSLAGGPEDGSAGPTGRVYRINPATGAVRLRAKGFLGATGLDVAGNGTIYVAELFGGRISRVAPGTRRPRPYLTAPLPADVELTRGRMFATVGVLTDDARLVRVRRSKG